MRKRKDESFKYKGNPLFVHKKKKPLPSKIKILVIVFASIVPVCIFFWLVFYSRYLRITDISVKGDVESIEARIRTELQDMFGWKKMLLPYNRNIITFDSDALREKLQSGYYFSELSIQKKYFHGLWVSFKLKPYSLVWQEDGKTYYIDAEARVIEGADNFNPQDNPYPVIENQSGAKMENRLIASHSELIKFVDAIDRSMRSSGLDQLKVDRYVADAKINAVTCRFATGPQVYFNITADPEQQFGKLASVINSKDWAQVSKKQYIDLRFGDMVYIK
jgi:cell division septal protein FtsQ